MTATRYYAIRSLFAFACVMLSACNPAKPTSSEHEKNVETSLEAQMELETTSKNLEKPSKSLVLELEAKLLDAATQANALNTETKAFLASPTEQGHADLLQTYQKAHQSYRLASAVLFLASGQSASNLLIDAFPMLPGYLDSVEGYPSSGLIHSEMNINLKTLEDEHQFSDELYLTLGFHPYEFILTGDPSSPIAAWRRFTIEGTEKQKLAAQRRSAYLALLATQLQNDIEQQTLWWQKSKPVRLAFLNDERVMEEYLEKERDHSGESGAKHIKAFWLSLDALQKSETPPMTEEAPEKTSPSDSSSPE
ncbi:hypothetical protein A3742_08510 [Oleiphilus sp. HI0071]|uniref:imelysin family protein n=1 Tax=unclassified Oleiphilus TaxID=2631174 RepID=UPI0007C3E6D3|nr:MULTISPECIES: imelysin family protein [unclassified Oleiphilus]KZY74605.1 hypothetical protein A3737_08590 [Oleiphilus sp. HI0065]KZY82710.1 hypothetical protein A3742_08510 [Oleiphilus sp. HI0071]KZY92747.1 hypothetical protein A3744_18935 [Oleiphilus sp. HI0073]KZZ51209.1 hypothetical protein A3760_01335 [Oleiphilus sp. HI0122]KZZ52567.1 hypothetical protein A3758_11305 [Oleiphilus sp. HI0118]KZZ64374.1 hypothetical protein A3765_07125 [Oleiphilus sp. HI0130]